MSTNDFKAVSGLTFFDRGVVDAAVALAASGGDHPALATLARFFA
jgi:predicted ATPase